MSDDEVAQLAERVAAAADAWLRDRRDVGVYRRLVDAVTAWREATRPQLDLIERAPGTITKHGGHTEPHQLRGVLADVAEELRRRSASDAAPETTSHD